MVSSTSSVGNGSEDISRRSLLKYDNWHHNICNRSILTGPDGDVVLDTDDYSVGAHNLTVTGTDVCGGMATSVLPFIINGMLRAIIILFLYSLILSLLSFFFVSLSTQLECISANNNASVFIQWSYLPFTQYLLLPF